MSEPGTIKGGANALIQIDAAQRFRALERNFQLVCQRCQSLEAEVGRLNKRLDLAAAKFKEMQQKQGTNHEIDPD